MKLNRLLSLAALLTAGWLPALSPTQTAWQQATAKVSGTLNAATRIAQQPPGSDTGKVNALAIHLDQLTERLEAQQLAFNEAMLNPGLTGDDRVAYLTLVGKDLQVQTESLTALTGSITTNFSGSLGGDFLASLSDALAARLSAFVDGFNVQAIIGGASSFRDPCVNFSHGGSAS